MPSSFWNRSLRRLLARGNESTSVGESETDGTTLPCECQSESAELRGKKTWKDRELYTLVTLVGPQPKALVEMCYAMRHPEQTEHGLPRSQYPVAASRRAFIAQCCL